jgi:hypothetical protein
VQIKAKEIRAQVAPSLTCDPSLPVYKNLSNTSSLHNISQNYSPKKVGSLVRNIHAQSLQVLDSTNTNSP